MRATAARAIANVPAARGDAQQTFGIRSTRENYGWPEPLGHLRSRPLTERCCCFAGTALASVEVTGVLRAVGANGSADQSAGLVSSRDAAVK